MTLIEVVAGLVILGTVLASLALARGRFARQWAAADRKLVAARALDALIANWMESSIPINRQGRLPNAKNCVWRTRASRNPGTSKLGAEVVRIEVFDLADAERSNATPVVSVDLLVHLAPKRTATAPSADAEVR
jgi:type II secretory pathway pseudopilin PulG